MVVFVRAARPLQEAKNPYKTLQNEGFCVLSALKVLPGIQILSRRSQNLIKVFPFGETTIAPYSSRAPPSALP